MSMCVTFLQMSHSFWTWKTPQKLVFFPRLALQRLLRTCWKIFLSLTQNLTHPFLGIQKSRVDTHSYVTSHCSANTQDTVLFHAGNDSTGSTQLYALWWTFVIPTGVSYMVSLETIWVHQAENRIQHQTKANDKNINSTKLRSQWEDDICSANPKVPHLLSNQKVHYVHKTTRIPYFSQFNPVHISSSCCFKPLHSNRTTQSL